MRLRNTLLAWIGVSLMVWSGCAHVKVSADWDQDINLSDFRTYAWAPGPQKETGDVRVDSTLLDKRIRKAVNAQLRSQGYSEASASNADLLLGYHLSRDRKLNARTINNSFGFRHRHFGVGGGSRTYINQYDVGTLIIDLFERADNELVWRGSGTARVRDESTPAAADRKVALVVAKILEQFPPTQ
jgi:hypothetical protein